MYVASMTSEEICERYKAEKLDCRRKAGHICEKNARYIRKARQNHLCVSIAEYWVHPKTKSEYIIVVIADTKNTAKNQALLYFPIIRDRGINLVFTNSVADQVTWFTPHFFDRYKERFGGDMADKDRIELVKRFAARNWRCSITMANKERNGETEWEVKIPDGAVMCQWDGERGILFGKTFITEDMQYDEQKKRLQDLRYCNSDEMTNLIALMMILTGQNTGEHRMLSY